MESTSVTRPVYVWHMRGFPELCRYNSQVCGATDPVARSWVAAQCLSVRLPWPSSLCSEVCLAFVFRTFALCLLLRVHKSSEYMRDTWDNHESLQPLKVQVLTVYQKITIKG